jgi:glycosyltransferase involved in cell wall biosynthesis
MPLRKKPTFVIPNPVNSRKFSPANSIRRSIILYVGRLERNKGVETIAAAMPLVLQKFPSAEFWFVGSDSIDHDGMNWRDKLRAAVAPAQRDQLRFEQLTREQMPEAYGQAAVCILPSVWENCPYALLEAMACATPVVATNGGGVPEIIEDGVSGFLVSSSSAVTFAARIVALLEDEDLREAIGTQARARIAELFSVGRVLPKMIGVYEDALDRAKQRSVRCDELPLPSQPQ